VVEEYRSRHDRERALIGYTDWNACMPAMLAKFNGTHVPMTGEKTSWGAEIPETEEARKTWKDNVIVGFGLWESESVQLPEGATLWFARCTSEMCTRICMRNIVLLVTPDEKALWIKFNRDGGRLLRKINQWHQLGEQMHATRWRR
jgi:hypothetical protein